MGRPSLPDHPASAEYNVSEEETHERLCLRMQDPVTAGTSLSRCHGKKTKLRLVNRKCRGSETERNDYEFGSEPPSADVSEAEEEDDRFPDFSLVDPLLRPLSPAAFSPVKHKYKALKQAKRTIYVRIPDTLKVKPFQIADACRQKLGSVQESVCEDAKIESHGICIVRLRQANLARRLVGQYLSIKDHSMQIQPYPTHRPQVYVAHIQHCDDNGIRVDSLLLRIAKATKKPFYIWEHTNLNRTICVIVFRLTHDLLFFDIDVQSGSGFHVSAHFSPATKTPHCRVCKGYYHPIQDCHYLREVTHSEVPEKLKDGKYLREAPKPF